MQILILAGKRVWSVTIFLLYRVENGWGPLWGGCICFRALVEESQRYSPGQDVCSSANFHSPVGSTRHAPLYLSSSSSKRQRQHADDTLLQIYSRCVRRMRFQTLIVAVLLMRLLCTVKGKHFCGLSILMAAMWLNVGGGQNFLIRHHFIFLKSLANLPFTVHCRFLWSLHYSWELSVYADDTQFTVHTALIVRTAAEALVIGQIIQQDFCICGGWVI